MNWWDLVRDAGDTLLARHGVLAAFVYLAVEESGVPIPVPGDFLMLTLGVRTRDGVIVLWQVIVAMEAGTVLASSLLVGLVLIRRGLPHPLPRPALGAWHRARVGLLAGLLSTAAALLTLDAVVVITGDLAWRLPESLPAEAAGQLSSALARDATGGLLWLVVTIMAGVGWGALYAVWAEPRLAGPDAVRGLVFALLSLLVDAGLLAPVLGQVGRRNTGGTCCSGDGAPAPGLFRPDSGAGVPSTAGTPPPGSGRRAGPVQSIRTTRDGCGFSPA